MPSAVIDKIEEYSGNNINNINPSIDFDEETNELTLYLELTRNEDEGTPEVVSVSLQSIINNALINLPAFIPATNENNGVPGLVPTATTSEVNSILTGGGWKTLDEIGVSNDLSNSNFECEFQTVRKTFTAGLYLYDDNGDVIGNCHNIQVNLRTNEDVSVELEIESQNGLSGCSISYPYNDLIPISSALRTFEYFQDISCWYDDKINNHYTITFQDGFTIDVSISNVDNISNIYTVIVRTYGPKANAPRQFYLEVDGIVSAYYYNMLDNDTRDYNIEAENISVYQRPSENTQLYDGEDISGVLSVELTSTPYTNDYLPLTFTRTETGITVEGKPINVNNWKREISNAELHIIQTKESGDEISNDISMNCIASYISSALSDIEGLINNETASRINADNAIVQQIGNISIPVYQGATTDANGVTGTVPSALIAERNKFLKGDGTWSNSTTTLYEKVSTVTGTEINLDEGSIFTKTVTADTTFTISHNIPNGYGACFNLVLINGGNYTVNWPNNVKWTDNTVPDLTQNGKDVFTFITNDSGTTWYATIVCSKI